jgi:hypothetical protein
LLAKLTKNILRGVNFTNLKTPGGYIAKSKPQGICLQLSQIPGGDYAIWPFFLNNKGCNIMARKVKNCLNRNNKNFLVVHK